MIFCIFLNYVIVIIIHIMIFLFLFSFSSFSLYMLTHSTTAAVPREVSNTTTIAIKKKTPIIIPKFLFYLLFLFLLRFFKLKFIFIFFIFFLSIFIYIYFKTVRIGLMRRWCFVLVFRN
jgi:hypothetical protein